MICQFQSKSHCAQSVLVSFGQKVWRRWKLIYIYQIKILYSQKCNLWIIHMIIIFISSSSCSSCSEGEEGAASVKRNNKQTCRPSQKTDAFSLTCQDLWCKVNHILTNSCLVIWWEFIRQELLLMCKFLVQMYRFSSPCPFILSLYTCALWCMHMIYRHRINPIHLYITVVQLNWAGGVC